MQNIQFYKSVIDAPGCISNGWNLLKPNYWMYFGIAIIAMILAGCIPCISLFLVGPVLGGVYFVILREMRGEPVEFGMMFKGFEKFVPLMVIGIVQSIPEIIGQILRITVDLGRLGLTGGGGRGNGNFFQGSDAAPLLAGGLLILAIVLALVFLVIGVTWRVLLFFAIPLAMEHDLGPIDAMKLSAKAAMSNVGGLIVLFILEFLVVLLGVLMLCIGVFFVIPIIYAANAFAYRQVFPMLNQTFQTVPRPGDYPGNFGQGM
jgi:uncharacterized membrane protein